MKLFKVILAASLLAVFLSSAAWAHHYICAYCGAGVSASNMPQPGNSCLKNPAGRFHSWILDDGDGRSHNWSCAYCGNRVNASHMPKPGNTCLKNPAGKFHSWIQND